MQNCITCNIQTVNSFFCSKSCAAKHNNKLRKKTDKSKLNTSNALKLFYQNNPKQKLAPAQKLCVICTNICSNNRKTCSNYCFRLLQSKTTSLRLSTMNRRNLGRGKKSFLEKSFFDWLTANHVKNFYEEKKFYNYELKKNYFADFTFPDLKLIIELDGTQHRLTVKLDLQRDEYISRVYGYEIIRITYSEYKSKIKLSLIKEKLGIP
jgi:very-short-patch-repair endonuclease